MFWWKIIITKKTKHKILTHRDSSKLCKLSNLTAVIITTTVWFLGTALSTGDKWFPFLSVFWNIVNQHDCFIYVAYNTSDNSKIWQSVQLCLFTSIHIKQILISKPIFLYRHFIESSYLFWFLEYFGMVLKYKMWNRKCFTRQHETVIIHRLSQYTWITGVLTLNGMNFRRFFWKWIKAFTECLSMLIFCRRPWGLNCIHLHFKQFDLGYTMPFF